MSASGGGKLLRRSDPLFAFTPATWVRGPVVSKDGVPEDDVAKAVVSATYFTGLGRIGLRDRMLTLSRIHVAATMVALYADHACPGSRPAGAGDLLSAAAYRANGITVSDPRSRLWGAGVHRAVVQALATGDEEVAILVLADIMLLAPEVLA